MAQLIERGDKVVCPNCQSVHSAQASEAYSNDFDANLVKPSSSLAGFFRTLYILGIGLMLIAAGTVGGWVLRDQGVGPEVLGFSSMRAVFGTEQIGPSQANAGPQDVLHPLTYGQAVQVSRTQSAGAGLFVSTGPAGVFTFSIDPSGRLEAPRQLADRAEGTLRSATTLLNSNNILAIEGDRTLALQAWHLDGTRLWATELGQTTPSGAPILVQAFAEGFVLLHAATSDETVQARYFDARGEEIWDSSTDLNARLHLSLHHSPLDEVIIVSRDTSDPSSVRIQSLTTAGFRGFQSEISAPSSEPISAVTVDPLGQVWLLFGGALPRIVVQDAMGMTEQSFVLLQGQDILPNDQCLIDAAYNKLRLACLRADTLTDYTFQIDDDALTLLERDSARFDGAETLLILREEHAVGLRRGNNQDAVPFNHPLRPLSSLDQISPPETDVPEPDR